jgi:2-isopropylmalate synthase
MLPLPVSRNWPTSKHEIFDEDLQALVSDEVVTPEEEHYKLVYSHVCSETGEMPHANVILSVGGVEHKARQVAAARSMRPSRRSRAIVGSGAELLLYSVNAITTGTDAQGEVTVRLARGAASSMATGPIPTSSSPRRGPPT